MRNKYAHIEAHGPEILEARIAPASVIASASWKTGTPGGVFELSAGEGLSTGGDASAYLLYIEKGNAMVFTTDFNNNGQLDENEITGIAAGDGLRIVLFADVHGDIVTNLKEQVIGGQPVLTLSDSNSNGVDDASNLKGDGRVLLNKRIEKIELRTLTVDDMTDVDGNGVINEADVNQRVAATSFSIFGNIYAGRGFGVASDPTSGLVVDSSGAALYTKVLMGETSVQPTIGSIKVGTAASGEWFSFGVSNADDTAGVIQQFTPTPGQKGADIAYVRAANIQTVFNINSMIAGNGGVGAAGGDVIGVTLNADNSGGYEVIAGNGGPGANGGKGGSILNFSDLGSQTGKVVFRSGSGGTGTTGTGGSAGDFTFDSMNIYGFVNIELGDGGSGFTGGGNGASLLTGDFTQTVSSYEAGAAAGTTHMPDTSSGSYTAAIGTTQAVDFDGDGYGDFVYSTVGTSQLVVVFGRDATPGNTADTVNSTRPDRIYLSGARNADALTVGDLNGDGHPDIAVGSSDANNRSGIVVFLSKFEDLNNDGYVNSVEDLNGNGENDFLGFYDGRFSALPQLNVPGLGANFPAQSITVGDIAAGDFDGDGMPELAVVGNYTAYNGEQWEVLVFLTADIEEDDLTGQSFLTGQFYADFGTKAVSGSNGNDIPADPRRPFMVLFEGNSGHAMIEATALSDTADHDVILVGTRDQAGDEGLISNQIRTIDYQNRQAPSLIGSFDLGQVDRNRDAGRFDLAAAYPQDFTIVDYDGDGVADVVAITGTTAGVNFMVASKGQNGGDGTGDFVSGTANRDNAGDFFANSTLAQIRAIDGDGDGTADDVVIFGSFAGGPDGVVVDVNENLTGSTPSTIITSFGLALASSVIPTGNYFADVWIPKVDRPGEPVAFWTQADDRINFAAVGGAPTLTANRILLAEPDFYIFAGDGGDSIVGNGGRGGGIGSGSQLGASTLIDPDTGEEVPTRDLLGSVQFAINGNIALTAGRGGDGFGKGGQGGSIVGVVSRGEANVSLDAGDGGRGVSAAGGAGGNLAANSIFGGFRFVAGDGGRGFVGGKGGSVIGNGTQVTPGASVPDTLLPGGFDDIDDPTDDLGYISRLTVRAGQGGEGTRAGGDGGSVVNFRGLLNITTFEMTAGNGGGAVSGNGGNGGNIKSSSPVTGSMISSDIALIAGHGGTGSARGGFGGSISDFRFNPPTDENGAPVLPGVLSVVAGHGGGAVHGNGGRGGDISGISVPTKGGGDGPVLAGYNYSFNRVLAGNGGSSAGGNGGAGGDIKNIVTSVGEAAYAMIAGAGGNGLRQGGTGGNVLNTELNGGGKSTSAKLLIVAGAGGDASSLVVNPNDALSLEEQAQKVFGGAAGKGGKGGSINGFKNSNADAHVDLIAGDGGSSLHYGTVIDKNPVVGRGGSISNVMLKGDAGNMGGPNYTVPLKSYNDVLNGQSMATWVEQYIRNNTDATGLDPAELTDANGNVGVIVGAAGRIKSAYNPDTGEFESLPATFAKQDGNGNLVNFRAASLASAVAGSIDRIAVINWAKGVLITKNPIGVDLGVVGQNDYLDKDGNPVPAPTREGRLIDGALYARKITDLLGRNVDLPGRDFPG